MKLTQLEIIQIAASPRGDWIFVRLHTDTGITGVGEASQSGNDRLVKVALEQLGERLVGADPMQVEVLWEQMVHATQIFSGDAGRIGGTAISAIDQALWDINGKALGVPVWQLLGGKHRDQVRLYANLNRGTNDRSPAGFARAAEQAVEAGFSAIKCTPFDEIHYSNLAREGLEDDVDIGVERLAQVRQVIGPEVELLVDCHCRFDLALALQVVQKLKPLKIAWFEEPVPAEQIAAMQELCQVSGLRIAGGEALFGRRGFWDMILQRAVHVIMPDVKHAGGLTECKRIAALAQMQQIPVAPHSPAGPVSTMAGVHLAAALPNFFILEYAFGEVEWRSQLIQPTEYVENGFITIPQVPGLGLELDETILERQRV